MKLNPTILVSFLLAGTSAAQVTNMPIRGMMPSFPTGFVLDNDQTRILKKQAGLPVVMTGFSNVGNGVAHFDAAQIHTALMPYLPPRGSLTLPEFDAMSSRNDLLPLIYQPGEFRISQGSTAGWAALYMGLEDIQGSIGVYGYYFDNPSFPRQLSNGLYLELDPTELPAGPVAMDVSMGLLEDNVGRMVVGQTEVLNQLYFSLTDASASTLWSELQAPRLTWADGSPYTPPANIGRYNGATIFVAEFDSAGLCTDVKIAEDASTLMLPAEIEVDALAIGSAQTNLPLDPATQSLLTASSWQYLISTEPPYRNEEILVVAYVDQFVAGQGIVSTRIQDPIRDNNGNSITGTGGTIRPKVRSLCGQDPELNNGGAAYGMPDEYFTSVGMTPPSQEMGLSVAARLISNQTDQFELTCVLSGWVGAPQLSVFELHMEIADGPMVGVSHTFPWMVRQATDDVISWKQPIDIPWVGIANDPSKNRYRFWVVQGGSQSLQVTESFRELVFRQQ